MRASDEKKALVSVSALFWVVFGLLALFTLFPHLQTGYTTNDDVRTAIIGADPSHSLRLPFELAKGHGRIANILKTSLSWLPYIFNSKNIYQLLRLGSLVINFVLFFILLKTYFQSFLYACFATILSLSFIQNNWGHNLITSYPFVFNFGFSCLFLSFLSYHKYGMEKNGRIWTWLCGSLFFLSMAIYEAFVLYAFVFFGLALYFERHDPLWTNRLGRIGRLFLPIAVPLVLFLFCHFLFQLFYPGHYSGVQIAEWSFGKALRVVLQYSIGTFPGAFFFADSISINATFDGFGTHQAGLRSLFQHSRVEWIAKACISAIFCWFLLRQKKAVLGRSSFLVAMIFGIALMVIPFVLLGLTPKYQDWVCRGSIAYTTSFFSFFGTIICLSSIAFYLNKLVGRIKIAAYIYTLLVSGSILIVTMMTAYYNHYVTLDQQLSQLKWTTIDRFIHTPEFKSLPEGSVIYAPSLWKARGIVSLHPEYWTEYVCQKSGKSVCIVHSQKGIPSCQRAPSYSQVYSHIYFLAFRQEQKDKNQYLIFAELKDPMKPVAKKVALFSLSKYSDFSLIGSVVGGEGKAKIFINGKETGQDQVRGGMFCCWVTNSLNLDLLRKEDVMNRSFLDLVGLVLRRALGPDSSRNGSTGLYKTEVESNAFIELENLTLSYYPSAMRFTNE